VVAPKLLNILGGTIDTSVHRTSWSVTALGVFTLSYFTSQHFLTYWLICVYLGVLPSRLSLLLSSTAWN